MKVIYFLYRHERLREVFRQHANFAGTEGKARIRPTGADKFSSLSVESPGDRKIKLHE